MSYKFSFKKLNVWVDSKELIKRIYTITKEFPSDEKFGFTSQLIRASVSLASNLAEGTARKIHKDKAHFTTLSFSSLMEVLNQIIIAKELNFTKEKDFQILRKENEKISNTLNALRKAQLNN
tara:strand:- start:450 stop:815 length:366 start_codon:yes stop_codon:yes gene_type:complete